MMTHFSDVYIQYREEMSSKFDLCSIVVVILFPTEGQQYKDENINNKNIIQ